MTHLDNLRRATESHRAMIGAMKQRSLELAAELEDQRTGTPPDPLGQTVLGAQGDGATSPPAGSEAQA